jgi:hypothetical protein
MVTTADITNTALCILGISWLCSHSRDDGFREGHTMYRGIVDRIEILFFS